MPLAFLTLAATFARGSQTWSDGPAKEGPRGVFTGASGAPAVGLPVSADLADELEESGYFTIMPDPVVVTLAEPEPALEPALVAVTVPAAPPAEPAVAEPVVVVEPVVAPVVAPTPAPTPAPAPVRGGVKIVAKPIDTAKDDDPAVAV